ncbi:hypothetical protein BRETT_001997 [Brettanomyces bruxellensis]|uniref:Uncharacterized protein n=1 Tax=Dekkera bruxellensis TaxID=5007 RepID=A0A871R5M3_DEKBR|nr:uncharacterized protein BRETT_001997 [Brettanomyces bruxellensis]QOU21833.1 hypothetical protein BRETT_001997 [Brettanomyces bruxellensis]
MKFSNIILLGSALLAEVFAAPVEPNGYEEDKLDGMYYRNDEGKAVRLGRRDIDTADMPAGAWYKTVTTSVDGKYGTYLEVVYTSTIRPATTYTLQNGEITTVSSVAKSTTTQSAVIATDPAEASSEATATSSENSSPEETESYDYSSTGSDFGSSIPASTVAENSTSSAFSTSSTQSTQSTQSTTSSSASSTITSSPVSSSGVQKVTASVSYSFPSSSDSEDSVSYTPYYTETAGNGVCIVYYAEDDETESYDDDTPYTTMTLTSVVATVTLTRS